MAMEKVKNITKKSTDIGNINVNRTRMDIGNTSYVEVVNKIRNEIYGSETVSSTVLKAGVQLLVGGLKGRLTKTQNDAIDHTLSAITPICEQYMVIKANDEVIKQISSQLNVNGHGKLGDTLMCLGNTLRTMIDEVFFLLEVAGASVVMDKHIVDNMSDILNELAVYRGKGLNDQTMKILEKIGLVNFTDTSIISNKGDGSLNIGNIFAGMDGSTNGSSSDIIGSFRDNISLTGGGSGGTLSDMLGLGNGGGMNFDFGGSDVGGGLNIDFGNSNGGSGGGLNFDFGGSDLGGGLNIDFGGSDTGGGSSDNLGSLFTDMISGNNGGFGDIKGNGSLLGGFEDDGNDSVNFSLI